MVVVDTSVLVDYFRGRDTAATRLLDDYDSQGVPYGIPALCCQEMLQGARDIHEWQTLETLLETQTIVRPQASYATHVAAARIFFDCRRQGLTVRSSNDCLVAQLALEHDAPLLHDDNDFVAIARVRPLTCLP